MPAPAPARRFALEDIKAGLENYVGFCLECGAERDCCEPDAENYPCDACDAEAVFGALQILMMDLVDRRRSGAFAMPQGAPAPLLVLSCQSIDETGGTVSPPFSNLPKLHP